MRNDKGLGIAPRFDLEQQRTASGHIARVPVVGDQPFAAALHDGIQPCLQRSGISQWLLLHQAQVA